MSTYEENFLKLQQLVESLENEALGLEESLKLFEEGMKLAHRCDEQLSVVEERVRVLCDDPSSLSTRADIPLEPVSKEALDT